MGSDLISSNRNEWTAVALGDVTCEVTERFGRKTTESPVYGVDRSVGLAPSPKYVAGDLSRYKRLLPGMFAYNPMRLNIGSIGYCSSQREPGLVSPDYVVFRCDTTRLDPEFLKYYVQSPSWRDWTVGSGVGSVRVRIYFRELARLPMLLPPIREQRAIAHMLGTLDDKIELNLKMNETLEAMARALFKSWFVDFDPVRAKAEGRDTGLPPHIADLFPDSFEDSELGEIPVGWRVGTVGGEFAITMGQSPPGETYNEAGNGLPFYQGRADFGPRFPNRRVYCTAPTRFASAGDTLVSVRAPVGDINMATESCGVGRGVAAVRHNAGGTAYTYQCMRDLRDAFAQYEAGGTVFGSIGKKEFHAMSCVVPPAALVTAFEEQAAPIDSRLLAGECESHVLASLRDTLLPRLVSGELRT